MKRLLIISVFLLSACGTIQPRMGMTFYELDKQSRRSLCNSLEMVAGVDDISIYHVRKDNPLQLSGCNPNIFYYFQDDKLVKMDQGQLYQQRYKIDINR
jgi:hypothetical protein